MVRNSIGQHIDEVLRPEYFNGSMIIYFVIFDGHNDVIWERSKRIFGRVSWLLYLHWLYNRKNNDFDIWEDRSNSFRL